MKKKIVLFSSIAGAVLLAGIITLICIICSKSPKSYRNIKIFQVEGTVTVERKNNTMSAYENMNLQNNDTLSVAENSNAILKLDDAKYVYVNPNSKIKLVATGKTESSKTRLLVEDGGVIVDVKKKLNENESFEIASSNSIMAIRGTQIIFNVERTENETIVRLATVKGKVDVTFVNDTNFNSINQNAGDSFTFTIPNNILMDVDGINKLIEKGFESAKNDTFDDLLSKSKLDIEYNQLSDDEINATKGIIDTFNQTKVNAWEEVLDIRSVLYGEELKPHAKATNGIVSYKYSTDGETYTDTLPTEVGKYYVKAYVLDEKYYLESEERIFHIVRDFSKALDVEYGYNLSNYQSLLSDGWEFKYPTNTILDLGYEDVEIVHSESGLEKTILINKKQCKNYFTLSPNISNEIYFRESLVPEGEAFCGDIMYVYYKKNNFATGGGTYQLVNQPRNDNPNYYTNIPQTTGSYAVKAIVNGNDFFSGLESDLIDFDYVQLTNQFVLNNGKTEILELEEEIGYGTDYSPIINGTTKYSTLGNSRNFDIIYYSYTDILDESTYEELYYRPEELGDYLVKLVVYSGLGFDEIESDYYKFSIVKGDINVVDYLGNSLEKNNDGIYELEIDYNLNSSSLDKYIYYKQFDNFTLKSFDSVVASDEYNGDTSTFIPASEFDNTTGTYYLACRITDMTDEYNETEIIVKLTINQFDAKVYQNGKEIELIDGMYDIGEVYGGTEYSSGPSPFKFFSISGMSTTDEYYLDEYDYYTVPYEVYVTYGNDKDNITATYSQDLNPGTAYIKIEIAGNDNVVSKDLIIKYENIILDRSNRVAELEKIKIESKFSEVNNPPYMDYFDGLNYTSDTFKNIYSSNAKNGIKFDIYKFRDGFYPNDMHDPAYIEKYYEGDNISKVDVIDEDGVYSIIPYFDFVQDEKYIISDLAFFLLVYPKVVDVTVTSEFYDYLADNEFEYEKQYERYAVDNSIYEIFFNESVFDNFFEVDGDYEVIGTYLVNSTNAFSKHFKLDQYNCKKDLCIMLDLDKKGYIANTNVIVAMYGEASLHDDLVDSDDFGLYEEEIDGEYYYFVSLENNRNGFYARTIEGSNVDTSGFADWYAFRDDGDYDYIINTYKLVYPTYDKMGNIVYETIDKLEEYTNPSSPNSDVLYHGVPGVYTLTVSINEKELRKYRQQTSTVKIYCRDDVEFDISLNDKWTYNETDYQYIYEVKDETIDVGSITVGFISKIHDDSDKIVTYELYSGDTPIEFSSLNDYTYEEIIGMSFDLKVTLENSLYHLGKTKNYTLSFVAPTPKLEYDLDVLESMGLHIDPTYRYTLQYYYDGNDAIADVESFVTDALTITGGGGVSEARLTQDGDEVYESKEIGTYTVEILVAASGLYEEHEFYIDIVVKNYRDVKATKVVTAYYTPVQSVDYDDVTNTYKVIWSNKYDSSIYIDDIFEFTDKDSNVIPFYGYDPNPNNPLGYEYLINYVPAEENRTNFVNSGLYDVTITVHGNSEYHSEILHFYIDLALENE